MVGKRIVDVLLAIILLLGFFWVLVAIAIILKIDSRDPIFFYQIRFGFKKRPFWIIKFRTMVGPDNKITRFRSFLRKNNLDELPQLINVIKGDMSLIGPRPCSLNCYQARDYADERFSVRPGLLGLAAIAYYGGDDLCLGHIKIYDLKYVKNISLKLDVMICLKALGILTKRCLGAL